MAMGTSTQRQVKVRWGSGVPGQPFPPGRAASVGWHHGVRPTMDQWSWSHCCDYLRVDVEMFTVSAFHLPPTTYMGAK